MYTGRAQLRSEVECLRKAILTCSSIIKLIEDRRRGQNRIHGASVTARNGMLLGPSCVLARCKFATNATLVCHRVWKAKRTIERFHHAPLRVCILSIARHTSVVGKRVYIMWKHPLNRVTSGHFPRRVEKYQSQHSAFQTTSKPLVSNSARFASQRLVYESYAVR
jgi:hypothetical protein